MVFSLQWTTIWFLLSVSAAIFVRSSAAKSQGLHVIQAPSSEELQAQHANGTSLVVVADDDLEAVVLDSMVRLVESGSADDDDELRGLTTTPESGRSIVTSLTRQASNLGKGFMHMLRGNPPVSAVGVRRPIVPFTGPVMRPHSLPPPLPSGFISRRPLPMPHVMLPSSSVQIPNPVPKDRVGPQVIQQRGDKFEGGFLPSKKHVLGYGGGGGHVQLEAQQTSGSVAINTSTLLLPTPKAPCDFYTENLCMETNPYPAEQMRHRLLTSEFGLPSVRRMLADVRQQNANVLVDGLTVQEEILYNYEHYYGRDENNTHSYSDYASDGGFVCPSDIKYVRLQKGRSPSRKWKFIVNFGEFTQTLRLEKCLKPYSRCSYVFSYLKSECIQIYNYHRLLAWDAEHGFHIDVFKVPTACSCHIRSDSSANAVMTERKLSQDTVKTNRKRLTDELEVTTVTERSYASPSSSSIRNSRTSAPDHYLNSESGSEVSAEIMSQQHHHPLQQQQQTAVDAAMRNKLSQQTKPSRFMLGMEPSRAQQIFLDLSVPHVPGHGLSDVQMTSSSQKSSNNAGSSSNNNNNNSNKWSPNLRPSMGQLSSDRLVRLDGPAPPPSPPRMMMMSPAHSSSFRRFRPVQGPIQSSRRRVSTVRRVNLSRNPVSDYMNISNV